MRDLDHLRRLMVPYDVRLALDQRGRWRLGLDLEMVRLRVIETCPPFSILLSAILIGIFSAPPRVLVGVIALVIREWKFHPEVSLKK